MSITLNSIELPDDILWENEFDWQSVAGSNDRTLGGTLIVWATPLLKGRPIDLVANESRGWLPRSTVLALYALAEQPSPYILTYKGEEFEVVFRYPDAPVIEVEPLMKSRVDFTGEDIYIGTIRLLEV